MDIPINIVRSLYVISLPQPLVGPSTGTSNFPLNLQEVRLYLKKILPETCRCREVTTTSALHGCVDKLVANDANCPVCRLRIEMILRVF